jgi:diadenylate cyclase
MSSGRDEQRRAALAASVTDLQGVAGVGSAQARGIREGLSRLAESSLLERYS